MLDKKAKEMIAYHDKYLLYIDRYMAEVNAEISAIRSVFVEKGLCSTEEFEKRKNVFLERLMKRLNENVKAADGDKTGL